MPSDTMPRLRIGIPKGSLQENMTKLFTLAGHDLRVRKMYPAPFFFV
jgi:ATP phosphoribosyltransferase